MKRLEVTDHSCLREKTAAVKGVHVGLFSIATALLGMTIGCAKTDAQAPPKEAPSGVTVTSDQAPPSAPKKAESVAEPPAPPSPAVGQSWPEAEKPSAAAREERSEAASEDQARPASAPKAARKASGAAAARAGGADRRGDLEESGSDLLVRINTANAQLTRDYVRLTDALELAVPDCQSAERLRRSVCQLADAVCDLEQELPKTTGRRCDDSKHRCSEATRRYESKCVE